MRHRRNSKTPNSSVHNDAASKPSLGTDRATDLDAQETEKAPNPSADPEHTKLAAKAELEALFRSFTDDDFGEDVARIAAFGNEPIHAELETEVREAVVRLHNFFQKAANDPAYGDGMFRKLRRRLNKTRTP